MLAILTSVLFTLFFFLTLLHYGFKELAQVRKVENVPAVRPFPVFGNIFDIIMTPSELFDFGRHLARKYKRFYRLWILQDSFINLLKPEDIEALLSNIKHIKKSRIYDQITPWLKEGLLTSYGSKWQSRRKILTPAFHFNILQQFVQVFGEHSKRLVSQLEIECQKDSTDVNSIMADVALNNICETAMGTNLKAVIDSDSIDYKCSIFRWSQLFVYRLQRYWLHPAVIYNLTPMGYQMRKVLKNLHSFTKGIITDRKKKLMTNVSLNAKTSDDEDKDEFHVKKRMAMLDLLLSAEARGENIDENGIHEEVDTFTFEGHDTTSMGLIFTLLSLADNPDVQRKAYEEIAEVFGEDEMPATIQDLQKLTYLDRCIKETLRLYPSVPFISRDLTEPLDLVDCRIPAGQIINVHIFDLHRDPDIYPNPEMFDPDRFLPEECAKRHPFAYIPFSAGPRNCIGQKFAMLELKSVVSTILRHYTLEAITKPKDLIFVIDIILRTDHPIKIKFRKRRPL